MYLFFMHVFVFYWLIFNVEIHRWKGSEERFDGIFLKFLSDLVIICKFKTV